VKIYINKEPVSGPWGGGNKFVYSLAHYLKNRNYHITFDLTPDVDIIFCFDPRPNSKGLWYQDFLNHKIQYNSKIIQRIGDVGTHSKPELTSLVEKTVQYSDYIIFPSNWARKYINYKGKNFFVINNSPASIFYEQRKAVPLSLPNKLKIVTHHWSTNEKKGFNFYANLGELIKTKKISDIEFTYIGRYNTNFSTSGIKLIKPKSSQELSSLLPKYDLYLTASIEEAGANHVLEAMAAGLPVIYRANGGSIEEYCKDFGIQYTDQDSMIKAIRIFQNNFKKYYYNISQYNAVLNNVIKEYEKIICLV